MESLKAVLLSRLVLVVVEVAVSDSRLVVSPVVVAAAVLVA
jgi:hypothetical protein